MWACGIILNNLLFCSKIMSIFCLIKEQNNSNINKYVVRIALHKNNNQIYKGNVFSVFAKHPDEKLKDCQLCRCSKYPDVMERRYLATNKKISSVCFILASFYIKLQNNGNYKHTLVFKNKSRAKCKNTIFMFLFSMSAVGI